MSIRSTCSSDNEKTNQTWKRWEPRPRLVLYLCDIQTLARAIGKMSLLVFVFQKINIDGDYIFAFSVIEPRNYKLLCTVSDLQDGWSVEIRQRMSGKGQGGLYRVYFKDGKQYLVKILGKVFCYCHVVANVFGKQSTCQ